MIIDSISDLHGHFPELEGGDLLIVAGDLTATGTYQEYILFGHWLRDQDYSNKVIIAGNHDNLLQTTDTIYDVLYDCDYLCDSGTEFSYFIDTLPEEDEGFLPSGKRTLKIWGSPWTKRFPGMNPKCMAFTVDTDEQLAEKWALIPDDTDILITHSPPFGILDRNFEEHHCGSLKLTLRAAEVEPKVHIFGHIHESYGDRGVSMSKKRLPAFMEIAKTISVNASHVNERYHPVNKPIRIEL